MKIAASAAIGFVFGTVGGCIGYFTVFIFTDVLQTAALRLDIEESHILMAVVVGCAVWGSIVGTLLALAQVGRRRAKPGIDTPIAAIDDTRDDVWPPAPRSE